MWHRLPLTSISSSPPSLHLSGSQTSRTLFCRHCRSPIGHIYLTPDSSGYTASSWVPCLQSSSTFPATRECVNTQTRSCHSPEGWARHFRAPKRKHRLLGRADRAFGSWPCPVRPRISPSAPCCAVSLPETTRPFHISGFSPFLYFSAWNALIPLVLMG